MWYIVVVFFASGSITGPAHFEDNWYPLPLGIESNLNICRKIATEVLRFLTFDAPNLNGEAFEVACIKTDSIEELTDTIRDKWTFEPAPVPNSAPSGHDTPV